LSHKTLGACLLPAFVALGLLICGSALAQQAEPYYRSVDGSEVHTPTHYPSSRYGRETALCEDGTQSYSHHHRGTCSHHGGVARWED
jgi:Protein of unknown function (DUF3761)